MSYPFTSKLHVGENVGVRNRSGFDNVLAGSKMPPKIGVRDWSGRASEDQQYKEDDQQAAIKAEQGVVSQWEMLGRSVYDDNGHSRRSSALKDANDLSPPHLITND